MFARLPAQCSTQFLSGPWTFGIPKQILRLSSIQRSGKWSYEHQILCQYLSYCVGQTSDDVLGIAPPLPRFVVHGQKTHSPIDDIYVPGRIHAVADLDGPQFGSTCWLATYMSVNICIPNFWHIDCGQLTCHM